MQLHSLLRSWNAHVVRNRPYMKKMSVSQIGSGEVCLRAGVEKFDNRMKQQNED